ncbi:Signal peptide peptidase SppA, 36K type [Candidatus Magnetomorum sp. HK-1]|nr:Signal peptide peptidase SppA, 36K type [Candidatus Magnetomorum sp. HK-1]
MKQFKKNSLLCLLFIISSLIASGCGPTKIKFYADAEDPLIEQTIMGYGKDKIAVIPITGFISESPAEKFMYTQPGTVQEIKSQLILAEKDPRVKAVLLKINSPGGTTTASDIIYNELINFKKRTGKKVISIFMDVAASGGYYVALPSDAIVAHPTTITGSIGVVMFSLQLKKLMEKIGVEMQVSKSGINKDMGSPFRIPSKVEKQLLQDLTRQLGDRFLSLVKKHRKTTPNDAKQIATARIFSAKDAKKLGLVDQIGYINDALLLAQKISGLPKNSRVIMYRRVSFPNDNIYNNISAKQFSQQSFSLINFELPGHLGELNDGFYYLWAPTWSGNQ